MSQEKRRPRYLHAHRSETGTLVAFAIVFALVLLVAGMLYFGGAFALPGT